jgi:cell division protein FtsI (penicillin-binding protein 3)
MRKVSGYASPCRCAGRIRALRWAGMALFAAVVAKLAVIQFLWRGELVERGERQLHARDPIVAPRGNIVDRNGHLLAVELSRVYRLAVDTRHLRSVQAAADSLAPLLGRSPRALRARLEERSGYLRLAEGLDEETAARVRAFELDGLHLEQTGRRLYPQGNVCGNLLGGLNAAGQPIGGLEAAYDTLLKGIDGVEYHLRTPGGRAHAASWRPRQEARPGADLELFLDLRLQAAAEEELAAACRRWKAAAGQVVVLDPHAGELLVLAGWPSFDPNDLGGYDPAAARLRGVTDMFEPGSTLKLLTFAAALEAGVIDDLEERIYCHEGKFRVAGVPIRDSNGEGYDTLSVAGIFAQSSNIGTALIAQRMEPARLFTTARSFGLGQPSGIDLPGETSGRLPPLKRWGPVEHANIAMGQGVALNAVQLAQAFGVVATEGLLVRPRLLRQRRGQDAVVASERLEVRRALEPATARVLKELLRRAIEEGTGSAAAVEGLPVHGKTGTAQKVDPVSGRYSRSEYIASFAGFAEIGGRSLVCVVLVDTPRGAVYGGTVAAPVFRAVIERALKLEQERPALERPLQWVEAGPPPPGRPAVEAGAALPALDGLSLRGALAALSPLGRPVRVEGPGRSVRRQVPPPGEPVAAVAEIVLWTE